MMSLDLISTLTGGRLGVHDVVCPACGPDRRDPANRKRRVLRIWHEEAGFARFRCARCELSGYARGDQAECNYVTLPKAAPADDGERTEKAMTLWREAGAPAGTVLLAYLQHRGLHLPEDVADLRFHAACPMGKERHPAMLALMRDPVTNDPTGVHRTALRPDGKGKAQMADGGPAKRMLGRAGAIKLTSDEEVSLGLGLTEGIENGLTVICGGWRPVWAAGSAGAIARFPVMAGIEALTIFADPEEAGTSSARQCAERWRSAGKEVTVIRPPADRDWNDEVAA